MSTDYPIQQVSWAQCAVPLRAIRALVFIDEQGVSQADEWDGQDESASHFLVSDPSQVNRKILEQPQGQAIATARLLPSGQIGRMAVLAPYRGRGIGSALLAFIVESSAAQACNRVFLHAQLQALSFYQQTGFVAYGPRFMDAGIPHQAMEYRGD